MHCFKFSRQMCQDFCKKYPEFSVEKDSYYLKYKDSSIKFFANDFEWTGKGLHLLVEFVEPRLKGTPVHKNRVILNTYERSYDFFESMHDWIINSYLSYTQSVYHFEQNKLNQQKWSNEIDEVLKTISYEHRWIGNGLCLKIGRYNFEVVKEIVKVLEKYEK